ncbi:MULTISPECIES: hypothetical protein [unclassified Pseudonocardia]|uniref:hypothetical protein n=1 Tax=unclassified Pseudonocardia TaxID=2619320 RepID=UPI0001FFE7C2|nr:hypothetical protein [Pseudonocardia sp. Ae707_Ps1]OLM17600.1 hypothetical protein Ae707Ps1_1859c [Pseudonocardia sp. Ae707_Ps1]
MTDAEEYHGEVRRTATPNVQVTERGTIEVDIPINIDPDGHWERMFMAPQSALFMIDQARIARPDRRAHPGLANRSSGHRISFRLSKSAELAEAVAKVDELIEQANREYVDNFIPAQTAEAKAAEEAADARVKLQADLNKIAATLAPPDQR